MLISLLEAILSIKIKNLEVKNSEIPRDLVDSKAGVLDIKAIIDNNIILDIEMQTTDKGNFKERSPFYLVSLGNEAIRKKNNDLLSQWLMLILGKEEELLMSKSTDAKILEAIERIDVMNMTPNA